MPALNRLLILAVLSLSVYVHAAPLRDVSGTDVNHMIQMTATEGGVTAAAVDDSNEFYGDLDTRDYDDAVNPDEEHLNTAEDSSTLEPFALRKAKAKPAPKPPKPPAPKQRSTKSTPLKTTAKPPKTTQAAPPTSTKTAPLKTTSTLSKATKVTSTPLPSNTTKATTTTTPSKPATTTSQSSKAEQASNTTTPAETTTAAEATDTTAAAETTTTIAADATTAADTTTPSDTTSPVETTTPAETTTATETTTSTETATSVETSISTATACAIQTPETGPIGARAYNYVAHLFRRDEPEFIGWHGTNSDTADFWQSKGQLEKPVKADGLLDFLGLGPRTTQGTSGADAELGPGVYATDDQDIAIAFANNNAQVNKGTSAQLCAIFAKSSDNWRTAIRKAFIPENLVGDSEDPQKKAALEQARLDHIAQAVPGVCAAAVVKFSLLDRQRLTGQMVLPELIANQFTATCFKADGGASASGTSTFPDFNYNGDTLRGEWNIAHE